MNKIIKYFFLNTYNQNPPETRISFEKIIEDKNNENEILAILLCCNKRNITFFLAHSLIKDLCTKVSLEVNTESIKIIQNEALLYLLKLKNRKQILNIISKLRTNNVIYYEEEQNIKTIIDNDKNTNILDTKNTIYEIDFLKNNNYLDLLNSLKELTKDLQNIYIKDKIENITNANKIFKIAILGSMGSGKNTLLKAINKTDSLPNNKASILHISNKKYNFIISDEMKEVLDFYNNTAIQSDIFLQSKITSCNIELYLIQNNSNPFARVYAESLLNNVDLIFYIIDVSKEINDIDINHIALIFKEKRSITIIWSHFDLITSDELKIIKTSVIKKIYFLLKRYKISETEIINNIDFITTAPEIAMMYIQNKDDLAQSKGFRIQDSGIYELNTYIKEQIFNNKQQLQIIKKELITKLSIELKIYIQMFKNQNTKIAFEDNFLESYKANLNRIKSKTYSKIIAMLKIVFETITQNNDRVNKQILLKIKINDFMGDIFSNSSKSFETATLNFLNDIKSSQNLEKIQKDIISLHLSIFKNEAKNIFMFKNQFLVNAIVELLNNNINKENFIHARKSIIICLNLESKIDMALQKANLCLRNIKETLNFDNIEDDLKSIRKILSNLSKLNKEK